MTKQNGQTQRETQLAARNPVDAVAERVRQFINSGQLHLPPDYSAENALKAAWLVLQEATDRNNRPALQVATRASIYNSLLNMVVQGLNPERKQGYFIVYGQQLVFQRSYFGEMALVKRVLPGANIHHNVVYQDDEFEYAINLGQIEITKHVQKLQNIDPKKIVGAYCVIEHDGKVVKTEVMTMDQIRQSWQRSRTYKPGGGNTPHHTEPDQMAIRTVVRRACKDVINSASDDYLFLQHYNQADYDASMAEVEAEADAFANGEVIDVEADYEVVDDEGNAPARAGAHDGADGDEYAEEPWDAGTEAEQASLGGPGF